MTEARQHGSTKQRLSEEVSPHALLEFLCDRVSAVTMMDRGEISPERSLLDYGLDSLVSLELRNWIRRTCHVDM
ncbi:hypothetical protein F4801DRAFT_562250 [Xylaria longipes]|nr:hypothetical protein F4801DRAFT_562250 [Xylaria longipes]